MRVYGASVIKGMLYTLKTFFETYIEDFKRLGGNQGEHESHGLRSFEEGVVTVQYPEEPMPIGSTYERFRVLPMLVYDQLPAGEKSEAPASTRAAQEFSDKNIRCTACGICAKVCPPQCIWIVQESDDKGKPITTPKDFFIDTAVCMNCGMCAEYCPFDAIKMDHQFALNVTEKRRDNYLYDMNKLLVPAEYYAELHPKANAEEEAARKAEAEAKAAKDAAKKEAAAKKAADAKLAAESGEAPAEAPKAGAAAVAGAEDPERAARIAAAKAKAAEAKAKREAEKAAAGGEAPAGDAAVAESAEAKPAKEVDPEREARIAAAKAKAAEAKAKREAEKAAAAGGEAPAPATEVSAEAAAATLVEPAEAKPAKEVDPEREARIAAAKAKAAEAKAKREAEKAAAAAVPVSETVTEPVAEPEPVTGVDKQEQTTTKESETMPDTTKPSAESDSKASIKAGADESEAIAQNDPVFTDPAPAGELGQEPDVALAQDGEEETPPPSSEGNFTPDTVTAGDEKAAQPTAAKQTSGTATEETVPLPSGALEAPAGDEYASASAHSAAKSEALDKAEADTTEDHPKASDETT